MQSRTFLTVCYTNGFHHKELQSFAERGVHLCSVSTPAIFVLPCLRNESQVVPIQFYEQWCTFFFGTVFYFLVSVLPYSILFQISHSIIKDFDISTNGRIVSLRHLKYTTLPHKTKRAFILF